MNERPHDGPQESTSVFPETSQSRSLAPLVELLGRRLYRFAGLLFVFAILYRYFDAISHVLLIAFVGAIVGVAFNAVVAKIPFGRGVSTAILAVAVLAGLALSFWFGITLLVAQIRAFTADMPAIVAGMEEWESWLEAQTGLDLELMGPRIQAMARDLFGGVEGTAVVAGAFGVLEIVAVSVLVLVGAFFLVAKPNEQLLVPLLRAVPRDRRKAYRRMLTLLGERLSAWLWGTMVSMIIIGTLAVIAFYFIGAPYPILLGVLVGVTDIIPLVGPWIGGIIAVLVTLILQPGLAIWVAVAVLVIQEVEGNLVRPMVMSEAAKLHPFVTLLALLLFASMFGLLGAILALPLLLALVTVVQVLWVEETLHSGEDEVEPLVEL
jgi:predicted PurR-regulated permease PerM